MASAWGASWGSAWGNSWGTLSAEAPKTHGFIIIDAEPRLWWKRKPKKLTETVAKERIQAVAKGIERVARDQAGEVPAEPTKARKQEVRRAIAPMLADMPAFDWIGLYRAILALINLETQRRIDAEFAQRLELERIRLRVQEEEAIFILMMEA